MSDDDPRPPQENPQIVAARIASDAQRRYYQVAFQAILGFQGSFQGSAFQSTAPVITLPGVLMSAVIVPGAKTKEGQLIEAVAPPWFEIIDLLRRDPAMVHALTARQWEEMIAAAYRKAGFDEVTLTPRSGDLGRDVIAVKRALGTVRVIDQVKAYKPGLLVTADDVRALLGVLHADGASKGFLTTTSDFAPKLREDILLQPYMPSRLELVNGEQLLLRLSELAKNKG
jgi:restriction system protein